MAWSPVLATEAEVLLFTKDCKAGDFGAIEDDDFEDIRTIIHQSVEAQILTFVNRTELEDGNDFMAANLKMATLMMVSNVFTYWKQVRAGKVISLGDLLVKVLDPEIFTKEIKKLIQPYRIYQLCSVDPDEVFEE